MQKDSDYYAELFAKILLIGIMLVIGYCFVGQKREKVPMAIPQERILVPD